MNPKAHDWDLDSFLFLGDQLWQGNLLFVNEFETKLPLLQQVFAVPAFFGGIGAWRVITFLLVVTCQVLSGVFLVAALNMQTKVLWVPISGIGALLTYSLPEANSSHIGMVASSFQLLAMTTSFLLAKKSNPLWHVLTGATWAIASNLRPNLIIVFFIVTLASALLTERTTVGHHLKGTLASVGGFGFLTLATFSPYTTSPQFLVRLVEGLQAIAGFSDGSSPTLLLIRFFINRYTIVFFASLVLGICFFLIRRATFVQRNRSSEIALVTLAGVVGLFVSFISSHYMPHHSVMFAPFAITLSALLIHGLTDRRGGAEYLRRYVSLLVLIGLLTTGLIALWILFQEWEGANWRINERQIDPSVSAFLERTNENHQSFYVVDGSQYHFLFSEERQGDGHPAMMAAFLNGRDIPILSDSINGDDESSTRCQALWARSPDVIVIENPETELGRIAADCLREQSDSYLPKSFNGASRALVFELSPINRIDP